MLSRCIVAIQVDGSPAETLHLWGNAIVKVLVEECDDFWIRLGSRRQVDVSNTISEKAQSVTPHPFLILRGDIHPVAVLAEGPLAKNGKDFVASDLPFLLFGLLQDATRLTLSKQPMGPHDQAFPRTTSLQFLDGQLVSLCELSQIPPPNGFVDVSGLVFVCDLGAVQGLNANRTMHLDKASFVVPAPVCRPAAKFKSLSHSLCLAILFVADVALRSRGFGMGPIRDLCLSHPSGGDLVCLITVASSSMGM
mmetsp:Transcript_3541/g.7979  ORF Transcript_3541/g.7979 Transcript_3541/m.7979 type:complete len:251 (-) Transcript_3541:264-1016(-)